MQTITQARQAQPVPHVTPVADVLPGTYSPVNVLLVDDDARNLDVLESILTSPEYRLVRAQNAEETLLALIGGDFAVIVLDIRMPDMDGLELAKIIKQRKKTQHIPIIFLTAYYQEDEHILHGYGAGAVDYISKPFNPVILRSKVAVFAELFRKTNALRAEIEERKRLEAEIAQAIEREQSRLGQELHDGLGQQLAGIGFLLGALHAKVGKAMPSGADEVRKLQKLVEQSVEQTRSLAKGFYPVDLEKHGLLVALQEIAWRTQQSFHVNCEVRADNTPGLDPTGQRAIQLFRITQEAVHNAIKHANAKQIAINLAASNGDIQLSIMDDGVGLPPNAAERKGMGLRIMHYRARMIGGKLDIRNGPSGGAIVTCSMLREE